MVRRISVVCMLCKGECGGCLEDGVVFVFLLVGIG